MKCLLSNMITVIVFGASGLLGREVYRVCRECEEFHVDITG